MVDKNLFRIRVFGGIMWQALIKLVEKLACCHEWELWREQQVESFGDHYAIFHFVCKKCGKFKRVKSS